VNDDVEEVARQIADALEAAEVPYAIGGAMAYSLWGQPRTTHDVDVNVFVDGPELEGALRALHAAGVVFDDGAARLGHADGGFFIGRAGPWRVDVFTPSIPFSWEAGRTRVRAPLLGREAWHLSAEATALFKLLFFRGKDIVDLERLVATQQRRMDLAYVRLWIVDMMGEDDARTAMWDDVVARFAPPPSESS
jgi:hypothetical protein